MEKIVALIDKLQELKHDEAALSELAYYTQLLYAELMCARSDAESLPQPARKKVAVIMPGHTGSSVPLRSPLPRMVPQERPEPVRIPEPAPEPEMAVEYAHVEDIPEMRSPAYLDERLSDPLPSRKMEEQAYVRELNEAMAEHTTSLNDRLKAEKVDLAAKLTSSVQVKDLTKALGINDKFLFINELFRGDRNMFDRSVKTINECGSLAEAEYWIGRELKIKLGWQDADAAVQQFYMLVKKRFS